MKFAIPAALLPLLATACAVPSQLANSATMTQALQTISAGHTGCMPADNRISSVQMQLNGSGTWNATCQNKTYLCSAFQGVSPSVSYSCAPAVSE
ncbi:MAG TPA: hypothetical protein VHY36_06035 [Steroidobacteraceae bacterium]|jgi:hypothetical protein|nr:hypothetical protein [Steroidobacteraceae bacterium]